MAIPLPALGLNQTEINPVAALGQGTLVRQQAETNQLENAKRGMENISTIALGVLDGNVDSQADPERWDQALQMYEQMGVDVAPLRGRPDMASVVARAGMGALGQMQQANADRNFEQALREFDFQVEQASKPPEPTAAMQNFDWAAGDPAKQAYIGMGDQPAGDSPTLTTIYDENGREQKGYMNGTEFVPVGSPKAATERPEFNVSQAAAAGYADRMVQSNAVLSQEALTAASMDQGQYAKNGVWVVGNSLTSPEFRQADQAKRDFINAILRRESGAVISDSEFDNANKQYFPVPGDDEETLRQKAANRQNAINGIARQAGPAYVMPDTTDYLSGGPPAPTTTGTPSADVPADVDPGVWEHLTEEERALWN